MNTKPSNPKDEMSRLQNRLPFGLVPSAGLVEVTLAFADGARKYGAYNWREVGVRAMTYADAILRHTRAWVDGEDCAVDSGVHHLGHAAAGALIVLDAIAVGNLHDDRPPPAPTGGILEAIKRGEYK